ncbi:MAG: hypothetical protein AAB447_01570 [Patescibacteria group bacterium]
MRKAQKCLTFLGFSLELLFFNINVILITEQKERTRMTRQKFKEWVDETHGKSVRRACLRQIGNQKTVTFLRAQKILNNVLTRRPPSEISRIKPFGPGGGIIVKITDGPRNPLI